MQTGQAGLQRTQDWHDSSQPGGPAYAGPPGMGCQGNHWVGEGSRCIGVGSQRMPEDVEEIHEGVPPAYAGHGPTRQTEAVGFVLNLERHQR